MIRVNYLNQVQHAFELFPVVALLGPRQVGKTTLARQFIETQQGFNFETHYFDLEDPTALSRLTSPKLTLQKLEGLVVIDEVQRAPELFPVLRYLVDRPRSKLRLLILGSASKDLLRQSSETLAGRIKFIEVSAFSAEELKKFSQERLWLQGGFPKAYLAESASDAFSWLEAYVTTYVERDIPALGVNIPAQSLRRFWQMLTHNHAQILNYSKLGRSFGASDNTIRSYIEILESTFMVRQLMPYHSNSKKRFVKSPKIYFRDSGVLHSLMGIKTSHQLDTHLALGASWEGFAIEQIIAKFDVKPYDCFFWSTHSGPEIDLLIQKSDGLHGFEIKHTDSPKVTKSMRVAQKDLNLKTLTIVVPNSPHYELEESVFVSDLESLVKSKEP